MLWATYLSLYSPTHSGEKPTFRGIWRRVRNPHAKHPLHEDLPIPYEVFPEKLRNEYEQSMRASDGGWHTLPRIM